jgi:4-aminobutyrate aminotransferase
MIGIEFASPELAEEVQWESFQRGLLVLECGRQTVRMCPPLVATAAEMATGIRIFGDAVAAVAANPDRARRAAEAAGAMPEGEVAG